MPFLFSSGQCCFQMSMAASFRSDCIYYHSNHFIHNFNSFFMKNLVLEWNGAALEAIRLTKPGPPMAARSLGILFTCIFDAWAAYDAVAKPVHSTVPRRPVPQRTQVNREDAVNRAAYRALLDQFPTTKSMLDAKLIELGGNPADNGVNVNNGIGVGNKSANDCLAFYHADNSNQAGGYADTTNYTSLNNPIRLAFPTVFEEIADCGRWQPLAYYNSDTEMPASPTFIGPQWGLVTPFALSSGSEFRPSAPASLISQNFLDQAKHVIEVQANLTTEQKVIAEYWADGPKSELPPGHWAIFTAFVVGRDRLDLDGSVKIFFAVANAISDAAIATWEAKRFYDYVRPVTAIRHLFRGKWIKGWGGPGLGTVDMKGESWRTFQTNVFPTPPFAEFTSGHSAFSMAAATALKRFTGNDRFGYFFSQSKPLAVDPSEPVVGVTLGWNTFSEAASEAGESRLYGGIHFYEGNMAGLDLGRKVGEKVFTKAEKHWLGTI